MSQIWGYARCSQTEDDKHNIQTQMDALVKAGVPPEYIKWEIASGGKQDRQELHRLLEELKPEDTLTVCYIDRLSRSVQQGLRILHELDQRGIYFRSLNEDFNTATPIGKLMLTITLAISEWELSSITERSKAGVERARREGRNPGRRPAIKPETGSVIIDLRKQGMSYSQIARTTKVSRATIKKYIMEKELETL